MADYRQIHTSIWDDDWFCQLSSDEKVVFVWLFSNRRASVSGIYKFAEFICSRETGIPLAAVKTAIQKLVTDQKIYIEGEWVWVKNLRKYNDSKSPNSYKRIEADLSLLPDNGMKKAYIAYYKPLVSPSIAPTEPPLEQEQEKEHEKEKESTLDPFDLMQRTIERLTGYGPMPKDIDATNEFVKKGVCEDDIKTAIAFLAGIGKTPRGAADLKGSVMTAFGKRTQAGTIKLAPMTEERLRRENQL